MLAASSPAMAQTNESISGGDGTLYLGGFPNQIWIIDEATMQVVDEIEVTSGIPRQLALSDDQTRFYLVNETFEQFEVVDIASRRSIDTFTLSEGNTKARIRRFKVHPDNRSVLLVLDSATKLVDRYEVAPRKLVQYDLERHAVIREVPWPDGRALNNPNMLFSPDGRLLYFLVDDVIVVDTATFEEVDRWRLSQPLEPGVGPLDLSFRLDPTNEEPGFFTDLFEVHDEVQDRDLMGIARIDLANRGVDFYTLGPAEPVRLALAPGGRKAYGIRNRIGDYELWTFDLDGRRVERRQPFEGRPRMALSVSTNGEVLYIWQAGRTIDLYDASTYEHLRTVALDGDMTTSLYVMPPPE